MQSQMKNQTADYLQGKRPEPLHSKVSGLPSIYLLLLQFIEHDDKSTILG